MLLPCVGHGCYQVSMSFMSVWMDLRICFQNWFKKLINYRLILLVLQNNDLYEGVKKMFVSHGSVIDMKTSVVSVSAFMFLCLCRLYQHCVRRGLYIDVLTKMYFNYYVDYIKNWGLYLASEVDHAWDKWCRETSQKRRQHWDSNPDVEVGGALLCSLCCQNCPLILL